MKIDNCEVAPVKCRRLPKDFAKAVRLLIRPYTRITQEEYKEILKITSRPSTDIVMWRGDLYTFGAADSGYALMPFNKEGKQYLRIET